jgi:RNA polymerase primary sigma factor
MSEKLITKSFERLLDKGKHRGFITYEELGKSLGKRNSTYENIERAFIILVDEKDNSCQVNQFFLKLLTPDLYY